MIGMFVLGLLACTADKGGGDSGIGVETEATWMQGAGYGWELFNHRVSHIEWGVGDAGVEAAIIGGTSTTGVDAELPKGCDEDRCEELPFLDDSAVFVRWVQARSSTVTFADGSATLVVGADGGSTTVDVDLPVAASGDALALIRHVSIDTDQPLTGGDACYTPAYGWQPTRIGVGLETPTGDGASRSVVVNAVFDAGESLEEIRQCIDDVNDQAQVQVTVDFIVAVVPGASATQDVAHGMSYTYGDGPSSPDEQPPPDGSERPLDLGLTDPLVGWSRVDWRFHVDDPDDRGAYLRTLSFDANDDATVASGHATNYSPITQLSGFDYQFEGTVAGFELPDGSSERGAVTDTIPAELDESGDPVVFTLGW